MLIDSTDIGKYTAFSSIGSDEDYDRYSWIGTFVLDESQTQETKNQTLYVYSGGIAFDEDIIIEENNREILLPAKSSGAGLIVIPMLTQNQTTSFEQPYIIAVYQGVQHQINLRYLATNDRFIDFGSGIEGTAFLFPKLNVVSSGVSSNPIGVSFSFFN